MNTPEKEDADLSLWNVDKWIDAIKKVSLLGGLLTGAGLAGFYFFGIAIYASYVTLFGIHPFDFSLQNCLEYGGASIVELVTVLPVLIIVGIGDNVKESNWGSSIFLGLPLVFFFSLWIFRKFHITKFRVFRHGVVLFFLLYMSFYWVLLYASFLSLFTTQDLLLDKNVNIALQHREELLEYENFQKFGINDWSAITSNIVLRDSDWLFGKLGGMFSLGLLSILYGIFALKASGGFIHEAKKQGEGVWKPIIIFRRVFIVAFILFLVIFLFVAPARTVALLTIDKPKVDVSIAGLTDLTSKYYLMLAGEYKDSFAFYIPNKQDVIYVQKDKVDYILYKEQISIFTDRWQFEKVPWLGVIVDWMPFAQGENFDQIAPNTTGLEVTSVAQDSPAFNANIFPHDILASLNNVKLDRPEKLFELIRNASLDEPIKLEIIRNGSPLEVIVPLEIRP